MASKDIYGIKGNNMENFIVSARKYRPGRFSDVVGQKSITDTLKNAIRSNHLAQAYLFCGPRGVGKTTCARILAKTINCMNRTPEDEACNECPSCQTFNENKAFNIHELDAASNNSVDDIRNLTDQVRIPPQSGKYSVYIIDEVHMLSQQAFNAFLKTLEEPPSHAIFILATTEKQKIIPTILSRCQIFDFQRIKVQDMVTYMKGISEKEDIQYETDALTMIAHKADGALRDALSIYDQIVSYSGRKIKYQDVIANLNILDYDYYFQMTDTFLKNDVSLALHVFNEILSRGFEGHVFVGGMSNHFRNLLVCKDPATLDLLEVGADIGNRYRQQAESCDPQWLFDALNIMYECDIHYKSSRNQRLHVELALIRICELRHDKKKTASGQQKQSVKEPEKNSEKKKSDPVDQPKSNEKTGNNKYSGATPSIRDVINGKDHGNKEKNTGKPWSIKTNAPPRDKNFTEEQLRTCWTDFASSLENSKPRMFNALRHHKPVLGNRFTVTIRFDNQDQLEGFQREIKKYLLDYLQNKLTNDLIVIEEGTIQNKSNKRLLYTPEEKFEHLSRKNPSLLRLKQEFDLDFE